MVDLSVLPGFVAAILLFLLPPGPDMAYMMAVGLEGGRTAALRAILGIGLGMSVYAVAVGVGVGRLLQEYPAFLIGLKLAGAAYLVWLCFVTVRHARDPIGEGSTGGEKWFLRGASVSLTNPKILLFFTAVLPQFLGSAENVSLQMLMLGLVDAGVEVVLYGFIGMLAGSFSSRVAGNPRISFRLNVMAAVVYLIIAGYVLLELRK